MSDSMTHSLLDANTTLTISVIEIYREIESIQECFSRISVFLMDWLNEDYNFLP